jgi:hypothetical protein
MRTKTLLIAAAALAVGIISSEAQVYSQNVVGYYNVPIPGTSSSTGFQIVANQLNCGVSNGLNEVFANGGLISDVNGSENSIVLIWDPIGASYAAYQYFNALDATADGYVGGAGFYDGGGGYITTIIPTGSSVFIQNLAGTNITIPIVGSVAQGTNYIYMGGAADVGQLSMVGSPIPVSTNVVSAPISFAGNSDVNASYNDNILIWDPVGGSFAAYQYFNAIDAAADSYVGGAGFYDGGGTFQTTAVTLPVGVGFFIQSFGGAANAGASETWTNIFKVQ